MLTYQDFRTGLTFAEIAQELHTERRIAHERGEYRWVTRRTILGRWCQYKRELYERYRAAHAK